MSTSHSPQTRLKGPAAISAAFWALSQSPTCATGASTGAEAGSNTQPGLRETFSLPLPPSTSSASTSNACYAPLNTSSPRNAPVGAACSMLNIPIHATPASSPQDGRLQALPEPFSSHNANTHLAASLPFQGSARQYSSNQAPPVAAAAGLLRDGLSHGGHRGSLSQPQLGVTIPPSTPPFAAGSTPTRYARSPLGSTASAVSSILNQPAYSGDYSGSYAQAGSASAASPKRRQPGSVSPGGRAPSPLLPKVREPRTYASRAGYAALSHQPSLHTASGFASTSPISPSLVQAVSSYSSHTGVSANNHASYSSPPSAHQQYQQQQQPTSYSLSPRGAMFVPVAAKGWQGGSIADPTRSKSTGTVTKYVPGVWAAPTVPPPSLLKPRRMSAKTSPRATAPRMPATGRHVNLSVQHATLTLQADQAQLLQNILSPATVEWTAGANYLANVNLAGLQVDATQGRGAFADVDQGAGNSRSSSSAGRSLQGYKRFASLERSMVAVVAGRVTADDGLVGTGGNSAPPGLGLRLKARAGRTDGLELQRAGSCSAPTTPRTTSDLLLAEPHPRSAVHDNTRRSPSTSAELAGHPLPVSPRATAGSSSRHVGHTRRLSHGVRISNNGNAGGNMKPAPAGSSTVAGTCAKALTHARGAGGGGSPAVAHALLGGASIKRPATYAELQSGRSLNGVCATAASAHSGIANPALATAAGRGMTEQQTMAAAGVQVDVGGLPLFAVESMNLDELEMQSNDGTTRGPAAINKSRQVSDAVSLVGNHGSAGVLLGPASLFRANGVSVEEKKHSGKVVRQTTGGFWSCFRCNTASVLFSNDDETHTAAPAAAPATAAGRQSLVEMCAQPLTRALTGDHGIHILMPTPAMDILTSVAEAGTASEGLSQTVLAALSTEHVAAQQTSADLLPPTMSAESSEVGCSAVVMGVAALPMPGDSSADSVAARKATARSPAEAAATAMPSPRNDLDSSLLRLGSSSNRVRAATGKAAIMPPAGATVKFQQSSNAEDLVCQPSGSSDASTCDEATAPPGSSREGEVSGLPVILSGPSVAAQVRQMADLPLAQMLNLLRESMELSSSAAAPAAGTVALPASMAAHGIVPSIPEQRNRRSSIAGSVKMRLSKRGGPVRKRTMSGGGRGPARSQPKAAPKTGKAAAAARTSKLPAGGTARSAAVQRKPAVNPLATTPTSGQVPGCVTPTAVSAGQLLDSSLCDNKQQSRGRKRRAVLDPVLTASMGQSLSTLAMAVPQQLAVMPDHVQTELPAATLYSDRCDVSAPQPSVYASYSFDPSVGVTEPAWSFLGSPKDGMGGGGGVSPWQGSPAAAPPMAASSAQPYAAQNAELLNNRSAASAAHATPTKASNTPVIAKHVSGAGSATKKATAAVAQRSPAGKPIASVGAASSRKLQPAQQQRAKPSVKVQLSDRLAVAGATEKTEQLQSQRQTAQKQMPLQQKSEPVPSWWLAPAESATALQKLLPVHRSTFTVASAAMVFDQPNSKAAGAALDTELELFQQHEREAMLCKEKPLFRRKDHNMHAPTADIRISSLLQDIVSQSSVKEQQQTQAVLFPATVAPLHSTFVVTSVSLAELTAGAVPPPSTPPSTLQPHNASDDLTTTAAAAVADGTADVLKPPQLLVSALQVLDSNSLHGEETQAQPLPDSRRNTDGEAEAVAHDDELVVEAHCVSADHPVAPADQQSSNADALHGALPHGCDSAALPLLLKPSTKLQVEGDDIVNDNNIPYTSSDSSQHGSAHNSCNSNSAHLLLAPHVSTPRAAAATPFHRHTGSGNGSYSSSAIVGGGSGGAAATAAAVAVGASGSSYARLAAVRSPGRTLERVSSSSIPRCADLASPSIAVVSRPPYIQTSQHQPASAIQFHTVFTVPAGSGGPSSEGDRSSSGGGNVTGPSTACSSPGPGWHDTSLGMPPIAGGRRSGAGRGGSGGGGGQLSPSRCSPGGAPTYVELQQRRSGMSTRTRSNSSVQSNSSCYAISLALLAPGSGTPHDAVAADAGEQSAGSTALQQQQQLLLNAAAGIPVSKSIRCSIPGLTAATEAAAAYLASTEPGSAGASATAPGSTTAEGPATAACTPAPPAASRVRVARGLSPPLLMSCSSCGSSMPVALGGVVVVPRSLGSATGGGSGVQPSMSDGMETLQVMSGGLATPMGTPLGAGKVPLPLTPRTPQSGGDWRTLQLVEYEATVSQFEEYLEAEEAAVKEVVSTEAVNAMSSPRLQLSKRAAAAHSKASSSCNSSQSGRTGDESSAAIAAAAGKYLASPLEVAVSDTSSSAPHIAPAALCACCQAATAPQLSTVSVNEAGEQVPAAAVDTLAASELSVEPACLEAAAGASAATTGVPEAKIRAAEEAQIGDAGPDLPRTNVLV